MRLPLVSPLLRPVIYDLLNCPPPITPPEPALLTEGGDTLVTESGDRIILE